MNDTTKPAAKAVAIPHKAPSRATIDTAQDELATLQYKLGRAQVAAMLSAGQAKADKAALVELETLVEEKRLAVETMVETFTNPTRSDPDVALEAIRTKLHDGGIVKPGVAYLVGEKTGEAIAGVRTATPGDTLVGVDPAKGPDQVVTIELTNTTTPEQAAKLQDQLRAAVNHTLTAQGGEFHGRGKRPPRVEDPEELNWGNDPVADEKGTAVAGVAYVTKTGEIVGEIRKAQGGVMILGEIRNAQPGDVEIPDTASPEPVAPAANHALHTGPTAPTFRPLLGDIWTDTSITPHLDRTWDGVRWVPAFPPAKPHKATRPPLDPVQGATWTYPRSSGDITLTFDTVEGWQIIAEAGTEMAHDRRVVASDLSSDFWEKGELEHVLNAARPRKQLFGRG